MKYCEKCYLDFPQPFQFCGSCGAATTDTQTCPTCQKLTESKWPFCTNCGSELSSSVREPKSAPVLSMMESYGHASEASSESSRWPGVLALIVLLLVGSAGISGWWWSHRKSPAQVAVMAPTMAQGPPTEKQSTPQSPKSLNPSDTSNTQSADEEFQSLLDMQTKEDTSDRTELSDAYAAAEKKHPNDYRFSYERAKLSIFGFATHHEAFGALAMAAEKAIDNGKAQEMLDSLIAYQDIDFHKLARGHREWQILLDALRDKDKTLLQALRH